MIRTTVEYSLLSGLMVCIAFGVMIGCATPASEPEQPLDSPAESEVQAEPAPPAESAPQAESPPIEMSWSIDTNEGAYGMPMSVINLQAGGVRMPVASGPGMRDMTDDERTRFRAPEGALAAAGYYAGFGVNVLVIQADGIIRVLEAIWDEGTPVEATYDYTELASISVSEIRAFRENPFTQEAWSGCFEGQSDVTTSTFDIVSEQGMLTADVSYVIEDEQNAYFTSARGSGGGTQIGDILFMELYITIEDDNQNSVEIWERTPEGLRVEGTVFQPCAS